MIRGIIFDNDGVLVDSEGFHYLSFKDMARERGVDLPLEAFELVLGNPVQVILSRLFPSWSKDERTDAARRTGEIFRERYLRDVPLTAGVRAFIDSRAVPMIVVSNGVRSNVSAILDSHGLDIPFLCVDDFIIPKPDPAGYRLALDRLGIKASEAVVFEDSPLGIISARTAGIAVIGVMTKHPRDVLIEHGALDAIPNFQDHALIDALLNRI